MVSKPKNQFSRPGIDLDRTKREWRDVSASTLHIDDTVVDYGKIVKVTHTGAHANVEFLSGKGLLLDHDKIVRAFVEVS